MIITSFLLKKNHKTLPEKMFYTPQQDLLKCSHCFLRLEKQISQQLLHLNQTKQTLKPHLTSHGSHGKEHVGSPKEKVTKKKKLPAVWAKKLETDFWNESAGSNRSCSVVPEKYVAVLFSLFFFAYSATGETLSSHWRIRDKLDKWNRTVSFSCRTGNGCMTAPPPPFFAFLPLNPTKWSN